MSGTESDPTPSPMKILKTFPISIPSVEFLTFPDSGISFLPVRPRGRVRVEVLGTGPVEQVFPERSSCEKCGMRVLSLERYTVYDHETYHWNEVGGSLL